MNIVLMESLGISKEKLDHLTSPLMEMGHNFSSYERNLNPSVQITQARDADIIILANMPLSGEVLRNCPNLKYIDIAFTGVDHIDLDTAKELGIHVSNAAGYSTESVAELSLCMMLSLLRNVPQVENRTRNNGTKEGLIGRELGNCTVGIIGTGAIGLRTAELCHAFGSKIIAYAPRKKEIPAYIQYVSFEELLTNSDIISLNCPLNNSTRHLINKDNLKLMKKDSLLINVARGPVVDYEALADALNHHQIGGAGIDVFETEPPIATSHPILNTPNTIVTPHVAFASKESMEKRAEIVFDNILNYLKGNQINKIL